MNSTATPSTADARAPSSGTIFLLDNQDSFAYNLVDELAQLGFELTVYRNQLSAEFIYSQMLKTSATQPVLLCLSPGPGHPENAGCLLELLALCAGKLPILGICLGFQAIIHQAGGRVGPSVEVMHGKTSAMHFQPHPIFKATGAAALPNPLQVARYHSLQAFDVPATLDILAHVDAIPMVVYDAKNRCLGFQFHPESIMTTFGSQLLKNSIEFLLAPVTSIRITSQGVPLTCNF